MNNGALQDRGTIVSKTWQLGQWMLTEAIIIISILYLTIYYRYMIYKGKKIAYTDIWNQSLSCIRVLMVLKKQWKSIFYPETQIWKKKKNQ